MDDVVLATTEERERNRRSVEASGRVYIDWDNRRYTEEVIEYRMGTTVVMTRQRCPAINTVKNIGQRCRRPITDGRDTCPSHRK